MNAEPRAARASFARALTYFPSVRRAWWKGMACIVPGSLIEVLVTPLILRQVIDGVIAGTMPVREVVLWALAILGLALVKGVFKYGMRFYITGASRDFERLYRQDLFAHLMRLTPGDLSHVRTGDVLSRSIADLEAVRMLLGPAVMYVAQAAIIVPVALAYMFWFDPTLTLVMLVPFLGLALVVKFAARPTQRWSHLAQERLAELSTVAQENFSGIRVVKAFAKEAVSESVFASMGRAFLESNVKLATVRGVTSAAIVAMKDAGMLVILFLGGFHLIEGTLGYGDFVTFFEQLNRALWPLIAVGWMLGMWSRAVAGERRLDELFSIQPSVVDRAPDGAAPPRVEGRIEVRHLSWDWGSTPALRDVSFVVPPGTVLGVTGRTGSGKSTLVQLVTRQVEPPPGRVLLDGRDVREWPLAGLRRALGVVPQDTFLFSDTVAANIGFASDTPERERIERAARTAQLEAEVRALPEGYGQLLGERGVTLSGGQRQRLAIARALASDAPVLVLDDCLSAVDSVTEQAILGELRQALRGRTAVVVSHRVAALSLADRVLVLDEGRVAEDGTHAELVARGGLYAAIAERQRIEEEIEAL